MQSRAVVLAAVLTVVSSAQPAAAGDSGAQAPSDAPAARGPTADLVYRTSASFRFAGLPLSLSARTVTTWRFTGDRYELHLHTDTVDFDQVSRGQVAPDGGLAPENYVEKRPFHDPEQVHIDRQDMRVRFAGAQATQLGDASAQDRLSLQFELARLRRQHPEQFGAGSSHVLHLIGTHDIDTWNFTVGEIESVDTGLGAQRAVRFSARRSVGKKDETIDIWLGADLDWMPLRIRMVDRNESVIDSVLQSMQRS